MLLYLLQRLAVLAATLVIASLVVFAVMEILPGDAAETMLGPTATPEAVAALAHKLGLDLPLHVRYARWIAGLAARRSRRLLRLRLADRAADRREPVVSLPLAAMAMALSAAIALAAGVYAADRRGRAGDALVMGLTPDRPRRAELLAGDPDGDRVRGHAAARSRRRLSRLGPPRPGGRGADPAGGRARRRRRRRS